MPGDTVFMLLFGLALLAYVVFYFKGRQYLIREPFVNESVAGSNSPTVNELVPEPSPVAKPREPRVLMEHTTRPYEKEAIRGVDDYEYNLVYNNESDRALSKGLRDKLMSQRPMDWAGLPPSSEQFQAGVRESFENAKPTVPDDAKPYKDVNGQAMVPPDSLQKEQRERQMLQTYHPKHPGSMTTYNLEDAMELIDKIYSDKNEIATVYHEKDSNVYEIVGTRKKSDKVRYEDEQAPASEGPVQSAGEASISVPYTANDYAAGKDPYYDTTGPSGKSRLGKWDYTAWTPGLERMFAPTGQKQEWY